MDLFWLLSGLVLRVVETCYGRYFSHTVSKLKTL